MKGLFIPEITAEMFRNGCLESIEALMADGEIYDIEYEPKQQWIPVSERLPEHKCGEYLCTSKWLEEDAEEVKVLEWGMVSKTANDCKKHPEMIAGRTFDGWGFGEDWYGKIDNVEKISAWMPLPEPYKEGDE